MNADYTGVRKYVIRAVCEAPLYIGNAYEGQGAPFIQAAGVAGAFADYIAKIYGKEKRNEWFGCDPETNKSAKKSRIAIEDGIFERGTLKLELRPRIRLDGETGTVQLSQLKGSHILSGQITNVELISQGAKFSFAVYQFINRKEDDRVVEWCLSALNHGDILFGGHLSTGCGEVRLLSVRNTNFDLCRKDDLKAWMNEEESTGIDIADQIKGIVQKKHNFYTIRISTNFKNSVLIKGNYLDFDRISEVLHDMEPEKVSAANMMNGKREFIIPGSSMKGAVRSRIESIAEYLGLDQSLMDNTFQNGAKIYFFDSILKEEGTARLIARNAINKMTGGVKNQSLFFEMLIGGETEQTIRISKPGNFEKAEKNDQWKEDDVKSMIGLILLALRDFAIGAASMGGGASIGRGFTDISRIRLFDGDDPLIDMNLLENKIVDDEKFMKSCLEILKTRRQFND